MGIEFEDKLVGEKRVPTTPSDLVPLENSLGNLVENLRTSPPSQSSSLLQTDKRKKHKKSVVKEEDEQIVFNYTESNMTFNPIFNPKFHKRGPLALGVRSQRSNISDNDTDDEVEKLMKTGKHH